MWIHYNTKEQAIEALIAKKFHEIETGAWVSANGEVRATIHPTYGTMVQVCYSEIE